MQNRQSGTKPKRAKNLLEMFRKGKGTPNGHNNDYLSPDEFAAQWVADLDRLVRGQETVLLRNGTLEEEDGHQFYFSSGKLAEQMWSTKSYQVIGFYRYLRASKPKLLEQPKAQLIVEE